MCMKRVTLFFIFIVIVVSFFSCMSGPQPAPKEPGPDKEETKQTSEKSPPQPGSPEGLMRRWVQALHEEDAETYENLYWPDAKKEIDLVTDKIELHGRSEILKQQQQLWDNFDVTGVDYSDPEVQRFPETNEVFFHFNLPNLGMHEHILFQERDGEWKIFEHLIARHWHLTVKTDFQAWADKNNSGWLEPAEYRRLHEAAVQLIMAPHKLETELDTYFDFDNNGYIGRKEIRFARLYFFGPALQRLIESGHGAMEEKLDANGNGRIEDEERKAGAGFALRFNHFDVEPKPVQNRFEENADMNGNGTFEPQEQIEIFYLIYEPVYLLPHTQETINRFFDRLAARAGQMDEAEAEIAGLEEVEMPEEHEEESTIRQKPLTNLKNKKVAVVGVDSLHSSISKETVEGLLLFLENSFVNSGKVRVIDRQNIQKITEEYQFQSTSLTDEDTAVEIGKLANADYIVTGALSKVGEQYYLNVKMIDVESGEIVGSSISDASVEDVFYDMVNTAVDRIMEP